MYRYLLNALAFMAVMVLLLMQITPEGEMLMADYHGVLYACLACTVMFVLNLSRFAYLFWQWCEE